MIGEIIAIIGLGLVLIGAIWGIRRERARHKKRMEQIKKGEWDGTGK